MGTALKDQGKLDESINAFNKAITLNPNHSQAYSNMGNTFQDQGKIEEAILAFQNLFL